MSSTAVVNFAKGEQKVQRIQLRDIATSHNPRCPCRNLLDNLANEGIELTTPMELVHQLALSDNPEDRAKYVALLEKYENGPQQLVELAESRRQHEAQPVLLRDFRSKVAGTTEYVTRYGVVCGERRLMAAAYNFAKHDCEPTLGAVVHKLTLEEAQDYAFDENFQRKNMSELEVGLYLRARREEVNPETGKHYSLREVATKLNMEYQYARGREALTYLPYEQQARLVAQGDKGITKAIAIGLALKAGKSVEELTAPKTHRDRTLNLKEVRELFDKNRDRTFDYLEALATVMQVSLETAIAESDKRLAEQVAA